MKKALFLTHINNYRMGLVQYTIPTICHWARKNGYELYWITTKYFNREAITCEKMQAGRFLDGLDYAAVVDADIMLRPDFVDPVGRIEDKYVWASYGFRSATRFALDDIVTISGGFYGTHKSNFSLWDFPKSDKEWEDMESKTLKNPHLLDEVVLCSNIIKNNLEIEGVHDDPDAYIRHFGSELIIDGLDTGIAQARETWLDWAAIWSELRTQS